MESRKQAAQFKSSIAKRTKIGADDDAQEESAEPRDAQAFLDALPPCDAQGNPPCIPFAGSELWPIPSLGRGERWPPPGDTGRYESSFGRVIENGVIVNRGSLPPDEPESWQSHPYLRGVQPIYEVCK
jgi:hypothetical protein